MIYTDRLITRKDTVIAMHSDFGVNHGNTSDAIKIFSRE